VWGKLNPKTTLKRELLLCPEGEELPRLDLLESGFTREAETEERWAGDEFA